MSKWNKNTDIDYKYPPTSVNVLIRVESSKPVFDNADIMVAHYIPKYTVAYSGVDDWHDYSEESDSFFIKEGWYANTTYIGDEYSSYFVDATVIEWKFIA